MAPQLEEMSSTERFISANQDVTFFAERLYTIALLGLVNFHGYLLLSEEMSRSLGPDCSSLEYSDLD